MTLRHRILELTLPLAMLASTSLSAATFTVTSSADSGPGSLRNAIDRANATGGTHIINFNLLPDSTITLASALPIIQRSVIINGNTAPGLTVDGGGSSPLFLIGPANTTFLLSDLTLRDGRGEYGGGCLAAVAPSGTTGQITLTRVAFIGCASASATASFTSQGSAVYVLNRNLSIQHARFENGTTLPSGAGAASLAEGGAIYIEASQTRQLTIQDSHFIGNRAYAADERTARGGALAIRGPVNTSIHHSRFIDNHVEGTLDARGAAIDAEDTGNLLIEDSLLFGNVAERYSALYAHSTTGTLRIRNNTVIGNSGGTAVDGRYPSIVIRNNSFADNAPMVDNGIQHLVLVGTSTDGPASITVSNNLLLPLDGATGPMCATIGSSTLITEFNIAPGRMQNCGPQFVSTLPAIHVEALRDDGGPVETLALRAGSSAIGAGNPATPSMTDPVTCVTTDARGISRPQDGHALGVPRCDAGAWESAGEASLFRDDFQPVLWRP